LSTLILSLVMFSVSASADYTWIQLDYPGALSTTAYGISGGNIVGYYGVGVTDHGFLYNGSTWTTLDPPGATSTVALGISGSNIVGQYSDGSGGHGFLYNGSSWTRLDYPGAIYTQANGISGGNIVGYYSDGVTDHGFLYNGFSWTTLDPPGTTSTVAIGISGSNIVGQYSDASGGHGFLYNGSSWTRLDYPGAIYTQANGISGGNIVGYYSDGVTDHGFLYNCFTWTTLDPPGTTSTVAIGISGSNIVGQYNWHGFLATQSTPPSYSISGEITAPGGTGIPGVLVTLSGAATGTTTTDSNGNYTFSGLVNGSYTIDPSMSGYAITPPPYNITINWANSTGDNFTLTTLTPCTSYTDGAWGACVNGTQTRTVTGYPAGCSGGVTLDPTTQICSSTGPTPVGYSPAWLIITLLSLTSAGGYLMRKRIASN
jgi:hypothetical protein